MNQFSGAKGEGMLTMKPIRNPGIRSQDLDGETLLYTADEQAIHILNPTAHRIWELCDGEHTVEDMAQTLQETFFIRKEYDVIRDVRRTLEEFVTKGLLKEKSKAVGQ